jgi:hypothetical protein
MVRDYKILHFSFFLIQTFNLAIRASLSNNPFSVALPLAPAGKSVVVTVVYFVVLLICFDLQTGMLVLRGALGTANREPGSKPHGKVNDVVTKSVSKSSHAHQMCLVNRNI